MKRGKQFTFEEFKIVINSYPSGYFVWDTLQADANIDPRIEQYACENLYQLHGENCRNTVDSTKVEVFYFER
jgi:hypothetical protein